MFKLVKSKTYRDLLDTNEISKEEIEKRNHLIDELKEEKDNLLDEYHLLEKEKHELEQELIEVQKTKNEELIELKGRVERLQEAFNNSDKNSVKIEFEDDFQKAMPIFRTKPETFDKMVELGYLKDSDQGNNTAVQLALMVAASEVMEQILSSFAGDE